MGGVGAGWLVSPEVTNEGGTVKLQYFHVIILQKDAS